LIKFSDNKDIDDKMQFFSDGSVECLEINELGSDFGLVAYYPFNGNADDAAGSNDGTVTGATLTTDRFGTADSAYSFDGDNDFISVADAGSTTNFSNTDDYSISLWFKSAVKGDQSITEHWEGGGYPWAIRGPNNSGYIEFKIYDGTNNPSAITTIDYSDNVWHHLVATKATTTKEMKVYIDGVLKKTTVYTTLNTTVSLADGFAIGRRKIATSGYEFEGLIDDVHIFNRALSSKEVKYLYDNVKISKEGMIKAREFLEV